MAYTVKQLAALANVSVRLLHWYDAIDLLKPAYHTHGRRRVYEEKELLVLQQILFFKELGFSLSDIKRLLKGNNFTIIRSLSTQKILLEREIERKRSLIATINKTIRHLKGEENMESKGFYEGFNPKKQKEYEQYIVQSHGTEAEKLLQECKRRTAKWDGEEWEKVKKEGDVIHKALAEAITNGLSPQSAQVQKIIDRHFALQNRFFHLTPHVYIELSKLYGEHPDFRKFFDRYHPEMIVFLQQAMQLYAEKMK